MSVRIFKILLADYEVMYGMVGKLLRDFLHLDSDPISDPIYILCPRFAHPLINLDYNVKAMHVSWPVVN